MKLFGVFILLASLLMPQYLVQAQEAAFSAEAEVAFGRQIEFIGEYRGSADLVSAMLFYQVEGLPETYEGEAEIALDGRIHYLLDVTHRPIRAFSMVKYWFELVTAAGETFSSPSFFVYYEDDRFEWRERDTARFRVHWYAGNTRFAQDVLDVAELGFQSAQNLLSFSLNQPVDIYVYASAQEMRAALQSFSQSWVGAHADPDLGVMVLSLPAGPEQRLEMERQIPHELMHILLYQKLGAGYANLPAWLNEGLASTAELYPNPDYLILMENAQRKGSLPAVQSLCRTFPKDASGAFLAYAQSASFTRYLHQRFGSSGMERLVQRYADGLECEKGVVAALGIPLSQLELEWRVEVLGENVYRTALVNLLPWLFFLAVVLIIPIGIALMGRRHRPFSTQIG